MKHQIALTAAGCRHELPQPDRLSRAITECLRQQGTALACVLGFSAALAAAAPLQAATFTVSNTNDAGAGSLRRALNAAVASPGPDEIVFASHVSGTITLTSGPLKHVDTYDHDTDDPPEDLIVTGPGKDKLTIDGNGGSAVFKARLVTGSLRVSGLTLKNADVGLDIGAFTDLDHGATIEDCKITETAKTGISIVGDSFMGYYSGPSLLQNLVISGNGGTAVELEDAKTIIAGSIIADNGGKGIESLNLHDEYWWRYGAPFEVENSAIARNGQSGLVCYSLGDTSVRRTQIIDNLGNGVACDWSVVEESTVSGNSGRGIAGSKIVVRGSTIVGNKGGGISAGPSYMYDSNSLTVLNSTISGNETNGQGGGVVQDYGDEGAYTLIENSTITDNKAAIGGGFYKSDGRTEATRIRNTIIAGNEAPRNPDTRLSAEVTYSLIGDPGDAYLTDPVPGSNLFRVDPLLGPLADNGGPTLTHALLPGSPAIDRGDPGVVDPAANDQRGTGFSRVVNGRIDMGAFEVQGGPAAVAAVGTWRPGDRKFRLDANGNGRWDGGAGGDRLTAAFGVATDLPVRGDWNGDGTADLGVRSPSSSQFALDMNGNGRWDGTAGGDLLTVAFGYAADLPVSGDWNGDGTDDIGVWRPSTRQFFLDLNGNHRWDLPRGGDLRIDGFGLATDLPVTGDWNGDGTDDIGVWRPSTGEFLLDANGNRRWDGVPGGDLQTAAFGAATDRPVAGDWNGDGTDDIGLWRPSTRQFRLDANGNHRWDGVAGGDVLTGTFGAATDVPVAGRW